MTSKNGQFIVAFLTDDNVLQNRIYIHILILYYTYFFRNLVYKFIVIVKIMYKQWCHLAVAVFTYEEYKYGGLKDYPQQKHYAGSQMSIVT